MFNKIESRSVGPLDGVFDLFSGETTIVGRSQVGKTSLLTSLCLCLWGTDEQGKTFPVDAITDGAEEASVELVTGKGTRFVRTIDRKRKTKREHYQPGDDVPHTHTSERAWNSKALGPLGRELKAGKRTIHAGRLIAVPFAWEDLASSAGGGREFRDVLDDIVAGGEDLRDVVARLMGDAGEDLSPSDPMTTKAAEADRREAKSRADRATGALQASKTALEELRESAPATGPSPEAVELAEAVLTDVRTWEDYDRDRSAWEKRRDDHVEAVKTWTRRVDELGGRPKADPVATEKARESLKFAESTVKVQGHALSKADKALGLLRQKREFQIDALEEKRQFAESRPDACPECGRPWEEESKDVGVDVDKLTEEIEALREPSPEIIEAEAELTRRRKELEESEGLRDRRRKELEKFEQAERDLHRWTTDRSALGEDPPPFSEAAPAPPDLDRVEEDDIEHARHTLRLRDSSAGAASAQAESIRRAEASVQSAEADLEKSRREAARLEALVEALRRAPSERLRSSLEKLGDTGPVSFRLPEGTDGVEVLIDGRPHWRASRGRRVVADLHLRMALRRALRMVWFPIFVDDVQSWSGDWPDTTEGGRPTPVVYLKTADVGLDIVEGRP